MSCSNWSKRSKPKAALNYNKGYIIDETVLMANYGAGGQLGTTPDLIGNKTPVLEVQGDRTRRVKVGAPVLLAAVATDDGKPRPRAMSPVVGASRTLPESATGLRSFFSSH